MKYLVWDDGLVGEEYAKSIEADNSRDAAHAWAEKIDYADGGCDYSIANGEYTATVTVLAEDRSTRYRFLVCGDLRPVYYVNVIKQEA